jgi:hypothetical protein
MYWLEYDKKCFKHMNAYIFLNIIVFDIQTINWLLRLYKYLWKLFLRSKHCWMSRTVKGMQFWYSFYWKKNSWLNKRMESLNLTVLCVRKVYFIDGIGFHYQIISNTKLKVYETFEIAVYIWCVSPT